MSDDKAQKIEIIDSMYGELSPNDLKEVLFNIHQDHINDSLKQMQELKKCISENKLKNKSNSHEDTYDVAMLSSKDAYSDSTFSDDIDYVIADIHLMLIEKNRKYGNSALEPKRIFSKVDSVEQLKVRIDDKLSRISNQNTDEDEDVVDDLIGYLILLKIAQKKEK